MENITLRQLRYLDALATHSHFGKAAQACAISQPALSMQIKELEKSAGAPLFERGSRAIRLTAFGEQYTARARSILRRVEDLDALSRVARGQLSGRLRIGVIPTIGPYLLPKLMQTLSAQYPSLDIHIRETVTERLIDGLRQATLDLAMVALPVSEPSLEEVPLFDEEFLLIRPAGDRNEPVPDGDMLAQMRLLLLEEGHCFREQALSFCNVDGPRTKEVMDGSSLSTLVQMVSAGMGVTLIPESARALETRNADVAVAHFPAPAPSRTVGLVWRRGSALSEQYQTLATITREALAPVSDGT